MGGKERRSNLILMINGSCGLSRKVLLEVFPEEGWVGLRKSKRKRNAGHPCLTPPWS